MKKLMPINHATAFTNTMKETRSLSHFVLFCLNSISAPGPRLVCIMRKSVFSSLCGPETHFRYAQGLQWAGTLSGFSIFIQTRTFALKRVEHQKSVNFAKKLEISIVEFQKSSKTFLINTYKEKSRRRTIIGSKVMLHWWSSSIDIRKFDISKVQANSKNTIEHT